MAGVAVSDWTGLLKTVYAEKLAEPVPDFALLQKKISFVGADKETGNYFAMPVALSHEAGFTYNGTAGSIATLNDAIASVMKEAQVYGSEVVLRSQIAYALLSRASKSGPKAFKKASAWLVDAMGNAARKRLEISMLYGQSGVATVSSVASDVITVTDATWAGGIWCGSEGSKLQAFTDATTSATQHGLTAGMTIVSVDSDAKTITLTASDTTTNGNVIAGDILYFKGTRTASAFNEMAGLHKIITNTGTLFNIAANTYSMWKGTTVSSVGEISHAAIQDALSRMVNKGLMEKVVALCSPKAFGVLNSDQAALRVFDASYSKAKAENGSEGLVFHSTNGQCEILSHPMVKDGDLFLVPLDSAMRLGSTDLTFGVPGMDENLFTLVSGSTAVELQCYMDQAIFLEKPAHAAYLSGLTYV